MSKLSLSGQNWDAFTLEDIFAISKVYGNPIENYKTGRYPYISTSAENNGLIGYVNAESSAVTQKNVISIDPIKGKAFYHPYEFVGRGFSGASIIILSNSYLNEHTGLFLCSAIENTAKEKASYGNLFNSVRLKHGKIMLPTTTSQTGEKIPDWQFMEDYIKELGGGYKIPSLETKRVSGTSSAREVKLTDRKWSNFRVDHVFEVINGVRLTDSDQTLGSRPFIGSTDKNNGITNWVSNSNKSLDKNSIGWNYNGSVGYNFYHPYEAVFSDDVKHLKIRGNNFSPEIAMFVSSQLEMQRSKYQYGYKLNSQRMNAQNVVLPTLPNDPKTPDWEFMEDYIKSLQNAQYLTQKIGLAS